MTVRNYIDRERELLLTYVSAEATLDDLLKANQELIEDQSLDTYDGIVLFEDLNRVVGPIPDGMRTISRQLDERYGSGGTYKTAFVISKDVDYGLLRMYTTYRGRDMQYVKLFFAITEAFDWVGVGETEQSRWLGIVERLKSGAN